MKTKQNLHHNLLLLILTVLVATKQNKQQKLAYLPLAVLMDVKEVIPHLPTVAADLAADGLLLFSLNKFSNWKLACEPAPLLYLP